MKVFAKGVESAVSLLGWTKCVRWSFISLLLINILAFSLFFHQNQNKIIARVVQDDTAIATNTILRNNSSLTSIKYLFIVRSDNKNLKARSAIRTSWYKDDTDTHHSWGTSIDAKLLFIIEDSQNTTEYAEQDLQFNDTLWIPNSGPRSIESVQFLEVVPTSHYYIIALDTTFINFDNIIHYVEKMGRNYMNYY